MAPNAKSRPWLRTWQSSLELHPYPRDFQGDPSQPPLEGEWTSGNVGFALRLSGPDRYSSATIVERAMNPADGETVLAQTVEIAGRAGVAKLVYRVYFGADPDRPTELRRIACRLAEIKFENGVS